MLRVPFRAGVTLVKLTRPYSKVTAYIRQLAAHDPLCRLAIALHSPTGTSLSEALRASCVSLDEFARWRPCVYASDIDEATENSQLSSHPSWLVLYLAGFKVHSPANASGALMDLSFAHMPLSPPSVQGPLLVLAMMHLARFDLVQPMKRVIDAFLSIPFTQHQNMHFNHLLSAMTSVQVPSSQTGINAVRVLCAMEARQLTLWSNTCSALLHDRHAALQLTAFLRRRQTRLGILPTSAQLEEYLRIYASDGAIHDAQRYADAIRDLRRGLKSDEEASALANRANRRNTFLVRSQPDSASAFHFLLGLAAKSGRDRPFSPRQRPSIHPRGLLGKRFVDIYDWSSALVVSVNDPNLSAKQLQQLFRRSRPKTSEFRATAAAYTILIRGLLSRKAWELAYIHWTKVTRSGLPIDEPVLAVGLEATILSGRPAEAFLLLEMHAARTDAPLSSFFRLHRRIRVTTRLIDSFMSCLHRILRPDLVFRLWDAMEDLYRLHPSPEMLRIVLEAAQLPHTLDDSFSGQLALLALKNPFRHPPSPPTTREALIESITAQAALPYRSGIWQGRPATETASRIFMKAVFGSPERVHLAELEPPAHAVRPYAESDGAAPTLLRPQWKLPHDILEPDGRTPLPTLLGLREQDFLAHVMLLGMTRRAPEIIHTLVWMRALGMRPRERTLGLALAFWSEVSVQPPLIAAMAGKGRDQYLKLVEWLKDWVGDEEVPDEQTVGRWRAKIARVRAQRRETAGVGRLVDEEQIWKM